LDWFVNIGRELVAIEDLSKAEVRCQVRGDQLFWVLLKSDSGPDEPIPGEDEQYLLPLESAPSLDEPIPGIGEHYELPQTPVTIEYERGGLFYAWDGVLSRYDGIGLDEQTRTLPCRVLVDNPRSARRIDKDGVLEANETGSNDSMIDSSTPPALLRGMYVRVKIHASPKAVLLSVPEKAIQPDETLFISQEDEEGTERLDIIPIEIVDIEGDNAVVRSEEPGALTSGQRVIISPMPLAIKGMEIVDERNLEDTEESAPSGEDST